MWMIRPSIVREVTIDLPEILVESLGVGAEMLAHYLTQLAEKGANNPGEHPPPSPILCRICERQITPWWFEKHTDLCLQEHRAEMEVQLTQEALVEHRSAIAKVLDALEAQSRVPRTASGETSPLLTPPPEYKGIPIPTSSTPSSGTPSGRSSPASPPSRSRDRSAGFGHSRGKSFAATRRPVHRIIELLMDLCDTAMEINTPAIKELGRSQSATDIRTQSPHSENLIIQVLQYQSPSSASTELGEGFRMLCDDTSTLSRAKVDAVLRHRRILEYSERIRVEYDILVQECIEAAMAKARRIAAGEDSSSDEEGEEQQEEEEERMSEANEVTPSEEAMFPASYDGPSLMAEALRNASDPSLPARLGRTSSIAGSNRSSSPRGGCQTPRSHPGAISIGTQNKRYSMHFESDAGADSDSSVRSSVMSGPRRADSPASELGLNRVAGSRERKRKSLVLSSVMSSRQHSPARSMIPPPSSPLRMSKPRIPSGVETLQSPVTSPTLGTSEFSSPAMALPPHHRRQSSAAGSDPMKPVSPRLVPLTAPQPRAVPPSIKDFEIIKPISKGAFGSVYLSKKKSTGDYFAIKVLKKADMIAKNQVTNVKAERAIMMWQGESDFVAKLYWTFSSKDYLYLVMEYLNGGDCASLIKVLGALPEDWAKKYLAEVVLGVEHLHSRNIIHRDLKPDNLLIDQKGHLKLTDFGLSRMGLIGRQKRALNSKPDEQAPDLLKAGPFHRATSVGSSRSASFDLNPSPSQTPSMTPALAGEMGQPSYFSLSRDTTHTRDPSRTASATRSEGADSEAMQAMFRRFSIVDDQLTQPRSRPIEEEAYSDDGSPDLWPLAPTISQSSIAQNSTPPPTSSMPPPPMALFDPGDNNRRFVGTPDYLAPETISGSGQDEVSDWWSLGCILFECLYGYPPFHADTPDQVFENILARRIDWPSPEEDEAEVSEEARDLINRLLCTDPSQRLGANSEGKFASGGEEIRNHPWFAGINWETLREDEASFIPAPENPEDTEYFDSRGAAMANFSEFEDQGTSSAGTPGGGNTEYFDRPHDALSRVRSQVNHASSRRGLLPLSIPAHVREGRSRRLSEPVAADDFGSFSYKNLPVLVKANRDAMEKMRSEAHRAPSIQSPGITSPSPSLESSPLLPVPLKRALSTKGTGRPSSPSVSGPTASPSRPSQPSSPLLVQFSTGQHHERRKTSNGAGSLLHTVSNPTSLQPGSFFDAPRLQGGLKASEAVSPIKMVKTPTSMGSTFAEKASSRPTSMIHIGPGLPVGSPRSRSQTIGSQEEDVVRDLVPNQHKRRSQVFDVSPSSSDTEDSRAKALLRVQRRRQSSRRLSQICLTEGPVFRPLDVLVCEDHPVSRLVMEKLLEKLRCRTLTVTTGGEAVRYAMGEVKFDIIMMEFKLPQINGADVARMIRDTKNANSHTPIVAVTGYLKELQAPHHFDGLIEKPPTITKLSDIMGKLCQWKPPPPNWTPSASQYPAMPSGLRQETTTTQQGDSPTSNSSGFPTVPSGSYRGSSREDSISSSFFTDTEGRTEDIPVTIARSVTDEWRDRDLPRMMGGLGISEEPVSAGGDVQKHAGHTLPVPLRGPPDHAAAHGGSAPAALESGTIRKQRSAEMVGAKRRILETRKHESAESGDDEDEELGSSCTHAKQRSPRTRPRPTSKLGIEMMRTNSRGSVISIEDIAPPESNLPSSPPPAIPEDTNAADVHRPGQSAVQRTPPALLTPPEIFPAIPGGGEMEDIHMETPKPPKQVERTDSDPTPRPYGFTTPASH